MNQMNIKIKGSGGKDILFYTTDDKQKGYMGTRLKIFW